MTVVYGAYRCDFLLHACLVAGLFQFTLSRGDVFHYVILNTSILTRIVEISFHSRGQSSTGKKYSECTKRSCLNYIFQSHRQKSLYPLYGGVAIYGSEYI